MKEIEKVGELWGKYHGNLLVLFLAASGVTAYFYPSVANWVNKHTPKAMPSNNLRDYSLLEDSLDGLNVLNFATQNNLSLSPKNNCSIPTSSFISPTKVLYVELCFGSPSTSSINTFDFGNGLGEVITSSLTSLNDPQMIDGNLVYVNQLDKSYKVITQKATGEVTTFSLGGANESTPRLSPDGKVGYISNRTGNDEIFVSNLDGTETIQVTNSQTNKKDFRFSPDGKSIGYLSQGENLSLQILSLDNPSNVQAVTEGVDVLSFDWAGNDHFVALVNNRYGLGPLDLPAENNDGKQEIWYIDAANPLHNWGIVKIYDTRVLNSVSIIPNVR